MTSPILCFGQQPCGIFPRRFLYAKFQTARRLQKELGGEIVFFFHDSDHDPRETQTGLRHRKTGEVHWVNFAFENKIQRKYSPLYLKRVPPGWQEKLARQLPAFVDKPLAEAFSSVRAATVADFCLAMYGALGLLEDVRVVRSSDPQVRAAACDITDRYADVPYEGEIVRARVSDGQLLLHEGGSAFQALPPVAVEKRQISPTRDSRLRWMQSVIGCTHYIAGAGEQAYLKCEDAPEITFVSRDTIDRSDEAWVDGLPAKS